MSTPKILPDPLDARIREELAFAAPEKPTDHGCAYFDDGCPWNICFACEFKRDPVGYQSRVRRSTNIEIITATFKNVKAGHAVAGWPHDLIATIAGELTKPRAERTYTDAQLADKALVAEPGSLLAALRALLPYC
jgi:hypothetical protein